MRFEVRAIANGRIDSIVVEALDIADARREALSRSLQVLSVRPLRSLQLSRRSSTSPSFPVDFFVEELSTLLEAGLSLVEAIETMCEKDQNPQTRNVLGAIVRGVHEGKRLSAALEALPDHLPPLLVAIVRAGERTGTLSQSLRRYATYRARMNGVRAKISSALVYPTILLVVGVVVTLFLLGYVVPRFAGVYQGSDSSLPWMSRMLLEWGLFVAANKAAVVITLGLLAASIWIGVSYALKRHGVAAICWFLPALQQRLILSELIRLYMTTGMLIDSGMPLVQALGLAQGALSPDVAQRLEAAIGQIENGDSVTRAFEAHELVTPVGLRLLHAGEGSGQMGEMLMRAAEYHDAELSRWLDRFTRSFEPMLMAAIGLVIGAVVVLLYLPIFDLAGDIH